MLVAPASARPTVLIAIWTHSPTGIQHACTNLASQPFVSGLYRESFAVGVVLASSQLFVVGKRPIADTTSPALIIIAVIIQVAPPVVRKRSVGCLLRVREKRQHPPELDIPKPIVAVWVTGVLQNKCAVCLPPSHQNPVHIGLRARYSAARRANEPNTRFTLLKVVLH